MSAKVVVGLITAILLIPACSSAIGMNSTVSDELSSTWFGYLNPGQMPTIRDIENYHRSYGSYPALTEEQSSHIFSPLKIVTDKLGTHLVDRKGMTLYVFDRDKEAGKSACYGGCSKLWPPYAAEASRLEPSSPLTLITRDDGSKQSAFEGKPLYYYAKDSRPGESKGEGVGKAWWIVEP